mmetsp:Transcript_38378/g.105881  ORF Transcript_38378/g.105881 Transcript_38378/m.105881 type:complete len:276 (+) Transcript_38378:678-1505(+)
MRISARGTMRYRCQATSDRVSGSMGDAFEALNKHQVVHHRNPLHRSYLRLPRQFHLGQCFHRCLRSDLRLFPRLLTDAAGMEQRVEDPNVTWLPAIQQHVSTCTRFIVMICMHANSSSIRTWHAGETYLFRNALLHHPHLQSLHHPLLLRRRRCQCCHLPYHHQHHQARRLPANLHHHHHRHTFLDHRIVWNSQRMASQACICVCINLTKCTLHSSTPRLPSLASLSTSSASHLNQLAHCSMRSLQTSCAIQGTRLPCQRAHQPKRYGAVAAQIS